MPRRQVRKIRFKDVFSNWDDFKVQKTGLVLVVFKDDSLKIVKLKEAKILDVKKKIFLGKIIKPTLRVGFLNAFLENYKKSVKNLDQILVPVLSKLKIEQIDGYFKMLEGLKLKIGKLERLIELGLFREGV